MASTWTAVLLVLAVLAVSVRAFPEQSVCTFSPIAPGHLHNDRFSVLNNDRTEITSFVAPNFAAGVLDFRSVVAGQTVTLGLAGGIAFDSETVGFVSGGAETFSSGTSLDINALLGSVNFEGSGSFQATASGGDLDVDSQNGNVNLLANNGEIRIEGAQVFFDGKYETLGVDFTTTNGGDISLRAGDLEEGTGFGNIDIKGSDVTLAGNLLTLQSIESDLSVSTQGTQIFAGETVSVGATNDIDITADLGDVLLDSGNSTTISGNTVSVSSSNRVIGRSVQDSVRVSTSGDVDLTAGDFTEIFATGDQVVSRDLQDCFGATLLARDSIEVSAVQYVDLIAEGATVAVTAGEFDLISTRGSVIVGNEETPSVSMTAAGAAVFDSSDDIFVHSLADTLLRTDTGDFVFDVSDQAKFSAVHEVALTADSATFDFDTYFGEFSGQSLMFGDAVDITVEDFTVSAGGDVRVEAALNGSFTFSDEFEATASELLRWRAETIDATANDDVSISSAGNVAFSAPIGSGSVTFVVEDNFSVDAERGKNTLHGGEVNLTASLQGASIDSDITSLGSLRHESDRDITLSAGIDVAVAAEEELTMTNDVFNSVSQGSTSIDADSSIRIDAQDTVQFGNGGTAVSTRTIISAGDDISIADGETYTFTADIISVTAGDTFLFARDEFNAAAESALTIQSSGDLSLASTTYVAFVGDDLDFTAGEDLILMADPRAGGEVRIRSETSSLTLTGAEYSVTAAQNVITGASVTFSADNSIDVTHEGPLDDVNFAIGGSMTYSGDTLNLQGSEVDLQSVSDVTISAELDDIVISTANGDTFTGTAVDDVSIAAVDVTFRDDFINIGYSVAADIAADDDILINADEGVFFNADGDINANFDGEITFTTNTDDVTVEATSDISLIGASVEIIGTTSVSMISGGGGHVFTAGTDISFVGDSSNFVSTTEGVNTFVAQAGNIEATSSDGSLTINGGNSTYSAGGDIVISSADTLNTATSRFDELTLQLSPGNILYHSGENYIETVELEWSVASSGPMYPSNDANNNPSNYGDGAGNGRIATTDADADICLFTIPDDGLDTASFAFSAAESMLVSAFGPDGYIDLLADGGITFTSQQHSIGMSAFGFTTDPEFLLTDNLGVLFRASRDEDSGDVVLTSAAGFSAFAQASIAVESTTGDSSFLAGDDVFVRTTDLDADINLRAQTGDMTFTVTEAALLTTGTSTTIGNANFNSTTTTVWTLDDFVLNQLGANTNDARQGALFQAFGGDINIDIADNSDGLFSSLQDGGVHMVTENGNALIEAVDEVRLEAFTGQVLLEGRTGGFLDSRPGSDITITSGKNVEFVTAGEEYLSIESLDTKLFFTATNGEVDVQATTGLFVTAVATLDLDGPCINFRGGGSVEFFSDADIALTSTDDVMRFDADVEVTIDADATFMVTADTVSLNAGGDESTTGVSLQSGDDVSFVTPLELRIDALSTVLQADEVLSVETIDAQTFTSTSASGTNDNLLVHATDGNIDINAVATVQMRGVEEHTVTTSLDMDFVADTARLLSNRDIRLTVENDMVVTAEQSITMNQAAGSWRSQDGVMTFTTAAADIDVNADSILSLVGTDGFFDAPTAITVSTGSNRSPITFESTEDDLVLGLNAPLTATSFTTMGLLDVDGPEAITVTSPLGTFTAGEDILIRTFAGAQLGDAGAPLSMTVNSNLDFVSHADEVVVESIGFEANPPVFRLNSKDDLTFTADDITFTPLGAVDFIVNSRTQDVELTGTTSLALTSNGLFFESDGNTENSGIELDSDTIDFDSSTDLIFAAEAGQVLLSTGDVTALTQDILFQASGVGGITFEVNGDYTASATSASLATAGGRVYLESGDMSLESTAGPIVFVSENADSDIALISPFLADFQADGSITIGSSDDTSNRFGEGQIRFEVDAQLSLDTPILDVRSEHDLRVSGELVTFAAGATADYSSLLSSTFTASSSLAVSTTNNLEIFTSTESDVIFSSSEIELSNAGQDVFFASNDVQFLASTRGSYDAASVSATSSANIEIQAGTDLVLTANGNVMTIGATAGDIRFENSEAGSEIQLSADPVTIVSTGDMEFHAGDLLYAEITSFAVTNEAEILSSNNVWLRASTVSVATTGAMNFGTQGSGNVNVQTSTHTIISAANVLFEARGNLGGLGGRYVAHHYVGVSGDQLDSIGDNINAIEVQSVAGDLDLIATTNVFIESHGGSIEIRSQNDILYSLSTASGNLGFYGILGTFPGSGLFQTIGFQRETDYCETNFGVDRCNTNSPGTCTVDCTNTSTVINDIAEMLVAYGLASCGASAGFCCVFPNC